MAAGARDISQTIPERSTGSYQAGSWANGHNLTVCVMRLVFAPVGRDVYSIDGLLNCLRSVGAKDRLHISLLRSKSQFQEVGF